MTNHEKAQKLLAIVKEIYEEMKDYASRDDVAGMVTYFNRRKASATDRNTYERLKKAGKKSLESEEDRFMAIARQLVVVGALLAAVAGCATASRQSWTKPGASDDDLARDRYACIQESRVPYDTSFGSAGFSPSGGGAGWGSSASVAQGGSSGGFILWGAARHAQTEANRIFDACMEARGWRGSN